MEMTFEYFREGAPHPLVRESSFNVSRRNIRKHRIVEAPPPSKYQIRIRSRVLIREGHGSIVHNNITIGACALLL